MNQPGGFGTYGFTFGDSFFGANVTKAVKNGTVTESRLNDMVVRIMTPYYFLGQDSPDFPTVDASTADLDSSNDPRAIWVYDFDMSGPKSRDVRGDHGDLIRQHGAAGTVLLKNEKNALPLKAPKNIAIFGNDASEDTVGPYNMDNNFEYGTLGVAGGSGTGRFTYLVTPLEAIKARARQDKSMVQTWLNNTLIIESNVTDLWIPQEPDVCLVFLKNWHAELVERQTLNVDWNGNKVVDKVAKVCSNTIVITHSGGVNVLPWADHPNVTAILAAHYPGQESGNSLVDLLYGAVSPSGKLPYTIAFEESDYNALPTTDIQTDGTDDWQSYFSEKLHIDYRYFDAHNVSVRYEFGYGLSYTTFELTKLRSKVVCRGGRKSITENPKKLPIQPGGNPALFENLYQVSVSIKNTGKVAGHAVPQLYVSLPNSAPDGTPLRQLRGFERIFLRQGQTRTVTFELMRRDLSYWDVVTQEWIIPKGDFKLSVGFSSRDFHQFGTITPIQ
jgi:beta-glucosidase